MNRVWNASALLGSIMLLVSTSGLAAGQPAGHLTLPPGATTVTDDESRESAQRLVTARGLGRRPGSIRPAHLLPGCGDALAGQADSAAVAQVVHQFHAALEAGDSIAALALLADDAIILESGDSETKQEYRSHHLPADIAFARAVRREGGPVRVKVRREVAWAASTSTVRGTYRDRPINSQSVELMVLEHTPAGWRIAAIHWSTRQLRS